MTVPAACPSSQTVSPGWNGEMARRIAAFDWQDTELGARSGWSGSLNANIQMLLGCPVPLVMLWGKAGTMIYNDAYSVFAGGRHPFLLGKPVEEGWPEVAAFNRHVVDTVLAGGVLSYRDKPLVLHRNGQPEDVWLDLHYSPVVDEAGVPAGVIAIVFETTERVLAEQARTEAEQALYLLNQNLEERVGLEVKARAAAEDRLRQVQKLEAVGGLTGGVAHDFNNVLQVISSNLQLLKLCVGDDARSQDRIKAANAAVARGAKLAQQLLAFARRQPLSPTVVSPARMAEAMSDLLRRAVPESIQLDVSIPDGAWNLYADVTQLESALLNLVINARDALRDAGAIRIEVANLVRTEDDPVNGGPDLPPGEYVRISVIDGGPGMTEDVKARAFEPFFSTKPEGHGTGLGLSMVFGFVKQSQGHIDLRTAVGKGTTVSLYFPRTHREDTPDEDGVVVSDMPRELTVLVVEDNADVRLSAIDMLAQLGHRVMSAKDGDAALAVLQQTEGIDLLFTDVVMPGTVRSSELARIAGGPPYNARVIFASGYTRDEIFHDGRLDEGVVLLSKPYSIEDLARTIRQVFAQRG
ncbi:ATP-binding protein [Cupriavidus plantarum]|uniref:ATP-binding protein n=1 Tax=Cupriavidus plantarum TaxID=942865 RepID=UPI000F2107ED|nr:ATP-binding protein [Cupriavidus plantarum]NYI01950.1 signal transduction histidine kinase [Cupriavidus plantarum]RLK31611.1 signal transduction histidine kinase [Cupriavidus plantarum]